MGRLIDADEYEKRIKPYDTEDIMDKALYNFAHEKLISTPTAEVTEEAVKEYCRKRCLCIVDSALLKKYASAQPERKKGKWTTRRTEYHDGEWWCTNCEQRCLETVMGKPRWKYCPYCGAEMEAEDGLDR